MTSRYRKVWEKDRARLVEIIEATENLSAEERCCAVELLDEYLGEDLDGQDTDTGSVPDDPDYLDDNDGEYLFIAALADDGGDRIEGYVCYGEAALAEGVFDIYWILVDPGSRSRGVGSGLIAAVEAALVRWGARKIVAETSGTAAYAAARSFYEGVGFREEGRLKDFFKPGDDKVFYVKDMDEQK